MDATYLIILHLSRKGIGDFVVYRMKQATDIPCQTAADGAPVKSGHVYIARPNQHLLVKNDHFILGGGPEENQFRPSIDVLFRSAAVAYSFHAINIILSGLLDDGTSGMWAMKRSGGTCVVQDHNENEYPDTPLSVISNFEVEYVASLSEMGGLIAKIIKGKKGRKKAVPKEVIAESKIAETSAVGIGDIEKIADLSAFPCPDCGGNLWAVKDDVIKRYRCHIGHAYTEKDLVIKQAETASATLWVELRMMEEKKHLLKKMQLKTENKGHRTLASNHVNRHDEMERHITTLKKILFDSQNQATA